jgi:hypothetical protein
MTTINLDPPAPEDTLVRMKNNQGCDEVNFGTRSIRPDHRRAFWIPKKDITRELLTVGGFYPEPLTKAESLQDVATHIGLMAKCRERDVLQAALVSLFEAVDTPEA